MLLNILTYLTQSLSGNKLTEDRVS
jgi:hypothetical protein